LEVHWRHGFVHLCAYRFPLNYYLPCYCQRSCKQCCVGQSEQFAAHSDADARGHSARRAIGAWFLPLFGCSGAFPICQRRQKIWNFQKM
jgi:hypothetical protein